MEISPTYVQLVVPVELTNDNERDIHWSKIMSRAKEIHDLISLVCRPPKTPFFETPVAIGVVRILGPGQRLWDFDSIGRGNAKHVIDGLVRAGWLIDDGPRYVHGVLWDQYSDRRNDGPSTLITMQEIDE